jgi:hypothetical protein
VKPPAAGRLVVADAEIKGLSLRIMPSGTKSWLVRYRPRQQPQKAHVPGTYPGLSLSAARQRARDVIGAAKRGIDLVAEEQRLEGERRKAAASSRTVRELAAEYIERECKPYQRRWRDVELRIGNHVLPKLGDRAVGDVRRSDIVELLDDLQHKKGLRQSVNRTRGTLATMFRFAIEHEYVMKITVSVVQLRPWAPLFQ